MALRPIISFLCGREDHRDGAVIAGVGVRHAPVEIVVARGPVHRLLTLVTRAVAGAAGALPAAVVIRDDIVAAVAGVMTSAHPGNGRGRRPGRTGGGSAATTGAQEPVNRAILPVIAAFRTIGPGLAFRR